MMKVVVCAWIVSALPLHAASYYPIRFDDPEAVYLTPDRFPVHADGAGDDSDAIQTAINAEEQAHGEGIVFVPEGQYRITKTIYVWPGIRIIGYGAHRPVFVLPDNTPGYQGGLGYMFFFAGSRPDSTHAHYRAPRPADLPPTEGTVPPNNTIPDANPGTFYSAMSNVDFKMGAGNAGAVAIRFHVAQHCFLAHIDFHIDSGLAALKDIGNVGQDLHFFGGDYGIITIRPSPGWQFTLLDSEFEGQRKAAVSEHEAGLTLVHDHFRNEPQAIDIDPNYSDELWIENSLFENITGPAITISNEKNPRTEISVEHSAFRNVKTVALLRESAHPIPGPSENYEVNTFTYGLTFKSPASAGEIATHLDARPVTEPPTWGAPAIAAPPAPESWVNLRTLGAKGDGVTDDTDAIRKAIATNRAIYVPMGHYVVTNTLELQPNTVLIGLDPSMTQFLLPDGTAGYQDPGPPKALLQTPRGGHNIVSGIGLYTNGINTRAVAALWMAGADSLMDDVRFLGGHGTNAVDGTRQNPYNNAHSADPDLKRRWDGQYPSLWVTNGGGGTFNDIWTPSTFAQTGLYVSDTDTPGHVYELSSEHHVRYEAMLDRVKNWEIVALQTEEERGEGGLALPLSIAQSENITLANFHSYKVISSYQPAPNVIEISNSRNLRFRNMLVVTNSKAGFDNTIEDKTNHTVVRNYNFASLDLPGVPAPAPHTPAGILAAGATVERLATGFFNISGAAVDDNGALYFVDNHWQSIYHWDEKARDAVVERAAPMDPVNLAFDKAGDLMVVSSGGTGTVYTFRPGTPETQMELLKPEPAAPQTNASPVLPVSVFAERYLAKTPAWQYVSPDKTTYIPADDTFVKGQTFYGIKFADILHAYGLAPSHPGHPFYISDEYEEQTFKVSVSPAGAIEKTDLFAEAGGEGVTQDKDGNVYIAAGQINVYGPNGDFKGQINVPERPINLIFGGPGHRTLYILTHTSLYAVKTKAPGL